MYKAKQQGRNGVALATVHRKTGQDASLPPGGSGKELCCGRSSSFAVHHGLGGNGAHDARCSR
jgi:hypothetical protein